MNGYFDDSSILRRIHRERAVALSGPRALLMQAAHPLAVSGLLAHSTALEEPYERLARTSEALSTIGFGTRAQADEVGRHVRAMHRRVRGRLPEAVGPYAAGTPYRADDPELLMWVLFTLVDSGAGRLPQVRGLALRAPRSAAYWEDYKVIGRLFGLRDSDLPETIDDLDEYRAEMLGGDRLFVTDWARRQARRIVLEPPVPWKARPLLETVNFVTIALLPDSIREPVRIRAGAAGVRAQGARCRRRRVRQAGRAAVPARAVAAGPARSRCLGRARSLTRGRSAGAGTRG